MNNAAILPYIGLHALQIQNVKRNVVKKASIKELNNEIIEPTPTDDLNHVENSHDISDPSGLEPVLANEGSNNLGTQID